MKYLSVLLLCCAGCIATGEKFHQQESKYGWSNAKFGAEFSGLQEARFTMYEGTLKWQRDENGNVILDSDGEPTVDIGTSEITYYLKSDPSAKEGTKLAEANYAANAQMFSGLLDFMTAMVPVMVARAQPEGTQ